MLLWAGAAGSQRGFIFDFSNTRLPWLVITSAFHFSRPVGSPVFFLRNVIPEIKETLKAKGRLWTFIACQQRFAIFIGWRSDADILSMMKNLNGLLSNMWVSPGRILSSKLSSLVFCSWTTDSDKILFASHPEHEIFTQRQDNNDKKNEIFRWI